MDIIYVNYIGFVLFFFFRKKSLIKSFSVYVYINIYKNCVDLNILRDWDSIIDY